MDLLAGKGMIFRLTIGIEDCENEILKAFHNTEKLENIKSFAKKPFSCSNFTFNMSKKITLSIKRRKYS
jgi:hypothetical protein